MKYRIAIAGLGAATRQIHLPAYAKIQELSLVGGCDPAKSTERFDFPLFASAEEMLDRTRPDILAVVTPPDAHARLARLGLAAGCHVFCEKPFASTLAEADTVITEARRAGRWVVVNNQYRFMEIHEAARRMIGGPLFGDLLFLSAQQTFFVTDATEAGWRGQDPHRTCKEFGTHVLDLCRYFFGESPRSITARMPRGPVGGGPDYLNLIQLEFSGDRVAQITLDRISRGPNRYLDIRLDGTAGCIETHLGGGVAFSAGIRGGTRRPYLGLDVSMGGWARLYHGERYRKIAADRLDLFAHATAKLMRGFIDALRRGEAPPCNAADNRATLALMLAAYESAEKREPVRLDGDRT